MKLKLLLLLFVFAAYSYADNESCLVIKQKSGNETVLDFSTNPIISFAGENMIVTNDVTTFSFSLEDIDYYYVIDTSSSGIEDTKGVPQFHNGHIVIKGLKEGSKVVVYNHKGSIIRNLSANTLGYIDINIRTLSKGLYIISSSNNIIKVINK